MDRQQRTQIFANALKLFTSDSAVAVKELAALDILPAKLEFGPDGYVVFTDSSDPTVYTQVASIQGQPLHWEVSSEPAGVALTPVQQRALRRYGFALSTQGDKNPSQPWPRERVDELPGWIERVFCDVFGLKENYAPLLVGGI